MSQPGRSDDEILSEFATVIGKLEGVERSNRETVIRLDKERFYRRRTTRAIAAAVTLVVGVVFLYHHQDTITSHANRDLIIDCLFPPAKHNPKRPSCYERLQAQQGASLGPFVNAIDADVRARLQQALDKLQHGDHTPLPLTPPVSFSIPARNTRSTTPAATTTTTAATVVIVIPATTAPPTTPTTVVMPSTTTTTNCLVRVLMVCV